MSQNTRTKYVKLSSPGIKFAQLWLNVENRSLLWSTDIKMHHFILWSFITPCMMQSKSVWRCFIKMNMDQQEINIKRDGPQRVKCSIPNICLVSLHGQIIFVLCFLPSESLLDEDVEGVFWNKTEVISFPAYFFIKTLNWLNEHPLCTAKTISCCLVSICCK